jgi:hypothetical protein
MVPITKWTVGVSCTAPAETDAVVLGGRLVDAAEGPRDVRRADLRLLRRFARTDVLFFFLLEQRLQLARGHPLDRRLRSRT